MKNRRFVAGSVMALLLALPAIGSTQMSFGGLGKGGGGGGDLSVQQNKLVQSYVAGGKDVLSAQAKLLEALGLKDQAATAQASADALGAGATKQNLEDSARIQSADSKALADAFKAEGAPLDAQSKVAYTQGLLLLASGLIKYTGMKDDVAGFSKGLSGPAALQAATKLQAGAYIVKTLPDSISSTTSTLSSAVSFARSHGIEVPADATKLL